MSAPDDDLDFGQTIRGFVEGQKVFGRYVLKHILGRGGMGVVWLAWDEKLEEDIALKFLPETVMLDASAIDELKRETRKSRKLTHPHIVRIHDFVEDRTSAAIAMEYVDGATLSAMRVAKPERVFEPRELEGVVCQICEALSYAHEKAKVVHRDLKPANVMVSAGGDIKVTDFGIARSISDSMSRMSVVSNSSGTLVYMSPQQMDGEDPAPADDIYSLGATLYELLAGRPPFVSGNIPSQIREKPPESLTARRAKLEAPAGLVNARWEQTIASCLEKDPARRPQTIQEVADRLLGRHALPVVEAKREPEAPAPAKEPKSPGRRKLVFIVFAVLAVLAALVGAGLLLIPSQLKQTDVRPTPSPTPLAIATPAPNPTPAPTIAPTPTPAVATKEQPFENTLGMKFVPVPGTDVLFSIWETRVKDYQAFCDATGRTWESRPFLQTADHPAVNVDGEDAKAFCEWLSRKEGKTYRLPTDHEWSCAVGIGEREDANASPRNKSGQIPDVFPWGTQWPPPDRAGNYWGEEIKTARGIKELKAVGIEPHHALYYDPISGLDDGIVITAPVGQFASNRLGIYDLGGNVWEWCEDLYFENDDARVLRGGSWNDHDRGNLLSSRRSTVGSGVYDRIGFRVACESR